MNEKLKSFKIQESERQSWGSLAMIWIGSMICVPSLMIGGLLGLSMTLPQVLLCIFIGYAIVCTYMCFMGMEGCDTGLPTVIMASGALGDKGAKYVISTLLAIACIGWFGVQSSVCGISFSTMVSGMTGFMIPTWISSLVWGLIMLGTAMYGYKALKILNFIAVPALIIVCFYGFFISVTQNNGFELIKNYVPTTPMSLVTGIGLVVASFALGGVISGDYSRYAKSRRDVIKSTLLGVLPAGLAMLLMGAAMSIVTGMYDISAVLSAAGVPAIGLLALVLATWTTNVINAYSGGLAVSDLFSLGENKFKMTTGIAGLIGTILAATGIMAQFEWFLSILTAFIPPLAGVVIASYWLIGKGKKENFKVVSGFSTSGLVAFVLGAAVAYITGNIYPFLIGPINGIVVSMMTYIILIKMVPDKETIEISYEEI